jgi:hypothetical protein
MMARPVAHYLMSFEKEVEAPAHLGHEAEFTPVASWQQETIDTSAEDHAQELEAARESARAEGFEAAQAEFAAEFERQRRNHLEALAVARQTWVEEEGEAVRAAVAGALAEIEMRLAQGVGKVLTPFVIDTLRNQMLTELVETIAALVGANQAILIKISGPPDLLEILRGKLKEVHAAIAYEATGGIEVSVRAEQTLIETQLSEWITRIRSEME